MARNRRTAGTIMTCDRQVSIACVPRLPHFTDLARLLIRLGATRDYHKLGVFAPEMEAESLG